MMKTRRLNRCSFGLIVCLIGFSLARVTRRWETKAKEATRQPY